MTILSLAFILFIFIVILLYYSVPAKYQWGVLLISSAFFYVTVCNLTGFLFVIFTSLTIYASTLGIQAITDRQKEYLKKNKDSISPEEKGRLKKVNGRKKRVILIITLLVNFGIMCVCKYANFAIGTVNSLFELNINNELSIFVPLGLSFYTFQSTGYLVNVYWNNCKPERNFLKVLLFISFFPQITQGPISEFSQLSSELFSEHKYEYKNFAYGAQRIIWGFFKKLLVASAMGECFVQTYISYNEYSGITTFLGAICYSIQIYADFSGYMDIMCGFCEILGIHLAENFDRPYFSKSIAEYWRRWHITLGAWFKQYIYYPIAVSKWNRNFSKKLTNSFGNTIGNNLPATIALIIVWFTTGLWHGATWGYVIWGGLNGFFIILSMWMEPFYIKTKKLLRINENSHLWGAFQIIRTFFLVTIIKVIPEVGTFRNGIYLWKHVFTNFDIPRSVQELLKFVSLKDMDLFFFVVAVIGTLLMFITSLIQYKCSVRDLFNKLPFLIRIVTLSCAITFILIYGMYGIIYFGNGGFMYAQF